MYVIQAGTVTFVPRDSHSSRVYVLIRSLSTAIVQDSDIVNKVAPSMCSVIGVLSEHCICDSVRCFVDTITLSGATLVTKALPAGARLICQSQVAVSLLVTILYKQPSSLFL